MAIILSVGLYAVVPLLQLGLQVWLQLRFQSLESPLEIGSDTLTPLATGGTYMLVSATEFWVQLIATLLFLALTALAWSGRPAWARLAFTAAVIVYGGLTAFFTLRTLMAPATLEQDISSADTLLDGALCGRLILTVLVPLYVVWYINRAPARAYFRGRIAPSADVKQ